MIDIDTGIPIPDGNSGRETYKFERFKPGDSTHVKTDRERKNVLIAFRYWTKHTEAGKKRKGAYATSRKVGADDPSGEGYRIWFMKREAAPQPIITSNEDEI